MDVAKRKFTTAFAPRSSACCTIRLRACSRDSVSRREYWPTSPPTTFRRPGRISRPTCRARNVLPWTSPSTLTVGLPSTDGVVTIIIYRSSGPALLVNGFYQRQEVPRPLYHGHVHHLTVQVQGASSGGLGFLPGLHYPAGVLYVFWVAAEGLIDGVYLGWMNGKLAIVAQLSGELGVLFQPLRVAEGDVGAVQRGYAGSPSGDGHGGPGDIDLLATVGALDAHIVGEVLRAKGDGNDAGRGHRHLLDVHDGPGRLDPGDDLDGARLQSSNSFQGTDDMVHLLQVPGRLGLANANAVKGRADEGGHFVPDQPGVQGVESHH